jgi:hypothetical protein
MPPVASTFSAMLPVSAPYAAAKVCMVSAHSGLDPSSAHWPITAFGSSVFMRSLQPRRLVHLLHVAQVRIDVLDAQAGDDALPAHAPVQRLAQILQQRNLAVGPCGEIAVSAFGRNRPMLLAVPDQQRLAQPGARRNQSAMPNRRGIALVQRHNRSPEQVRESHTHLPPGR